MQLLSNDYLAHHGILGQKWGVRRYQNLDGTLTPEGLERDRAANARFRETGSFQPKSSSSSSKSTSTTKTTSSKATRAQTSKPSGNSKASAIKEKVRALATKENAKKVAIGAAIVAGTALAVYGGLHYSELRGAASTMLRSGATAAQKVVAKTAAATKDASKALEGVSKLATEVHDEIRPEKKTPKVDEKVEAAANEVSEKVYEKVAEKSKVAGLAVSTASKAATDAVFTRQSSGGVETVDAKEVFTQSDMDKLLDNIQKLGNYADVGSKVLGSIGNSTDDLANELLKRLGNTRLR